jgi:VWFA-related protein
MRILSAAVLSGVLVVSAPVPTSGQESAPANPTIHGATARVVDVSVVVTHPNGAPAADLTAGDFQVFDNGRRQEIRMFRVENFGRFAAISAPSQPPRPDFKQHVVRTISNRTPPDPASPNPITVILIDVRDIYNPDRMTWTDLVHARDALVKFLQQVRSEDRLGIYLMEKRGFWILHEYTRNCSDIVARVATWKDRANTALSATRDAADVWSEFAAHFAGVDAATASAIKRAQFALTAPINRGLDNPLAVLESVAAHLAALPGRKNVVLVSGQVLLPTDFKVRSRTLQAILQAGVAIYAIDPSGLASYEFDASVASPSWATAASPRPRREASVYVNEAQRHMSMLVQSSLSALAVDTGGQVFLNSNEILGAIRSSVDDSRVTYTVGYYPRGLTGDGQFHKITVKVTRRRGLSVRHRAGYFDRNDSASDMQRHEAEMRYAVWSPVDASAIGLEAEIPAARPGVLDEYPLKLTISLGGVGLQPEGDRWCGALDVVLVQRDSSGNEYEYSRQSLGLKLQEDTYRGVLQNGVAYRSRVKLNPKATSIRAIVRDPSSGNLGSLTIPVGNAGKEP